MVHYKVVGDSLQVVSARRSARENRQASPEGGASYDLSGARFGGEPVQEGNLHFTMLVNWFEEVLRPVPGAK